MTNTDPFQLLQDLEKRTEQEASKFPVANQIAGEWVGLAFRVGKVKLITSMGSVKEVLEVPETTVIPGVKSWVVGIANVRGGLLPLIDLKNYLLGDDVEKREKGRVIVIDYKGFGTGLVVDEVYGMRHFRENEILTSLPNINKKIAPYISQAFEQEKEQWPVFSLDAVTKDERFANASL